MIWLLSIEFAHDGELLLFGRRGRRCLELNLPERHAKDVARDFVFFPHGLLDARLDGLFERHA